MRYLSALAFVVCLLVSSAAFAQEPRVLVELPDQQRQGTFTSGSVLIDPAESWQAFIIVRPVIGSADMTDPTKSFVVSLERADATVPGGWRHVMSADWRGGQPLPGMSMSAVDAMGKRFRFALDVPVRMRLGAQIFDSPVDLEDLPQQ